MLEVTPIETRSLSLLSYIIRDRVSGECLVVDPPRDIGLHIRQDLKVKTVVNTHIHFDHTLGNAFFRGKTRILAHRDDGQVFYCAVNAAVTAVLTRRIPPRIAFTLREGDQISLGDEKLAVFHTPGHSPGSICLAWPGNLISGDTIFAGGVGRTDLPFGDSAQLKRSLTRLMTLPDDTLVWPGHNYGATYPITMRANRRALVWALNSLG